jgi:hypothetical protein
MDLERITASSTPERTMTKPRRQTAKSGEIPADIRQRVVTDFGPQLADEIYAYLLDRIPDGLANGTRPRHLRCILYLAQGDRKLLDRFIDMCLLDTRDVMLQAEYETDAKLRHVRKRDLAKPFSRAELKGAKRPSS